MQASVALRFALAAALLLAGPAALDAEERVDFERCRLASGNAPAVYASCATLEVPENPAEPDGPTLELFVARIGAATASPRPDPLLIVTGGPGQSAVDFYLQARPAFEPVRRDRELILLDQRGTGRSADGFACSVPDDLSVEMADEQVIGRYVEACLGELERNPRYFSTSIAVQDLDRLRTALDVEQWNLYGVSYGTRVVQHYLRRFPEPTRAAILDGVVPSTVALGPEIAKHAQAALDAIFRRCEADPACLERFGPLAPRFRAVAAALAAEPVNAPVLDTGTGQVTTQPFTHAHLQAVVRLLSYSTQTASLLPLLVSEADAGNHGPLAGQAQLLLRGLPEALSFPMHNSVVCTEDYPFFPSGPVPGEGIAYLGTTIVDALERICARWPRGVMDEDFKEPLATDRPILLLSGEDDPVTPPGYAAEAIAGGFTNAVHVIGNDQGHGLAVVGCVPRLLRVFLENPVPAELDSECLATEPPAPFFLSFLGPAP